ncbi:MAG: cobaltochelatase subunit CobT, partial [Candidatus Micropelagos thuwalensis]|nr:cobaltochelatase subunit CobT [Candidatus Micropelagos thuwalensis]
MTEETIDRFKRAISQTIRSLAENDELDVTFGTETPSVVGNRVRLPLPPRDLPKKDRTLLRGQADSIALQMAHHDKPLSAK